MAMLEVNCLEKIYKTRMSGNQAICRSSKGRGAASGYKHHGMFRFLWNRENIWQLWENPEVVRQHF